MLPKNHRLSRVDFISTKSKGKSLRFPILSLVVNPNTQDFNRYSVVTSSKLHKHAVVRNHLRRQIYSVLPSNLKGHDVIIYPNQSMLNLTNEDLSSLLYIALSKLTPSQP